ncbi:hypothetical protein M758_6G196600 [Ceratodon purpureus]|nr:hypothetical protein M758_6G196600 [Ceratodon purpureus]
MDCALDESDARDLGLLGAFVNVSEHNSVPCFYSCTISIASYSQPAFYVLVSRRANDWGAHEDYFVKAVNLVEAIRILVACPTLTEVQFSFGGMAYWEVWNSVLPWSENLLSEVFTLLRSSPSLSCFHFINSQTVHYANLYCKHLQALVCENPRLETLTVSAHGPMLVVAKAIADCLSRNTVLKSFTLRIPTLSNDQKQQSLEILLRPFTSSSPSEANASLKELALHLQYPDGYCRDAIANLVCRNTTLKKLDLFFPRNFYSWRELRALASALQSNTTLKHVQCINGLDGYGNYTRDDAKKVTDKNLWQEEFQIQEILRTMIDNELRINTSLESFVVGHWTLLRVGTEWRTSYRGPCLREQIKEYNVKVKMIP